MARLVLPAKLYERGHESALLRAAFERVASSGTAEFVFVTGESGVGKTALVNDFQASLVPARSAFGWGRLDPQRRNVPFGAVADALTDLVRRVLSEGEAYSARFRGAVREVADESGPLIAQLIPELSRFLGPELPRSEVPVEENRNRLELTLERLIAAFTKAKHPLVLFLDDLQWGDLATLAFVRQIMERGGLGHVLLLGACRRDDGPRPSEEMLLEKFLELGPTVSEVSLLPLRVDGAVELVTDALGDWSPRSESLARLLHAKTGGNPLHLGELLTALADGGVIERGPTGDDFRWDLDAVRAHTLGATVTELLLYKLARLSPLARDAMKLLACLGRSAERGLLEQLSGRKTATLHEALDESARAGLVIVRGAECRFVHDCIREASDALLSGPERAHLHLLVAEHLLAVEPEERRDHLIFDIVGHLEHAGPLLSSVDEQRQAARLNLIAGRRAKAAAAYDAAARYGAAASALLGEDGFEREYPLALAVERLRAECEFLTGELSSADARLSLTARRIEDLADLAEVVSLRTEVLVAKNCAAEAVEVCLDYLHRAGVDLPAHPTEEQVCDEYQLLLSNLARVGSERIALLPAMENATLRAGMDVLLAMLPATVLTDKALHDLAVVRMANLSLRHGNCDGSAMAYAHVSMALPPRFEDRDRAFLFGNIALELVGRAGAHRFRGRVQTVVGYHVYPWTRPHALGKALMRRARTFATEGGDLAFVSFTGVHLVAFGLALGEPLERLHRDAQRRLEFARKTQFTLIVRCLEGLLALIESLRGTEATIIVDEAALAIDPVQAFAACWHFIRKTQALVIAGDDEAATAAARAAEPLLWTSRTFFELAEFRYYAALASAGTGDAKAVADHHQHLSAWAARCPENFGSRAALVEAELARLEERTARAAYLYERAIAAARASGFVHEEAIAHERAARFYAARGLLTNADALRAGARRCYERWGAHGKVRQLDGAARAPGVPPGAKNENRTESFDMETIVRVSQAVSSEMVLGRLIERLLSIAVEHAGATRGVLVLPGKDGPTSEAEAVAGADGVVVRTRQVPVSTEELPESVIRYVLRTRDGIIVDDASGANPFSADDYLRRTGARSVSCLPLTKHSELIGVLYLENCLTSHVFTPNRVAVLRLLASQAAVSIENARLYAELRRTELYLSEAQRLTSTGSFAWPLGATEMFWSDTTYDIFEYDRSTVPTPERVFRRHHPEERDTVAREFGDGSRFPTSWESERRLLMPDGTVKHVHVVGQTVHGSPDGPEFVGAVMDVTARKDVEERLWAARQRYAVTLSSIGDGVIATDDRSRISFINSAAESLTGWLQTDALGLLLDEVFCVVRAHGQPVLVGRDGRRTPIEERRAPILDDGERSGIVVVFRDVTLRRRAEQAETLQLTNERLELALSGSQVGVWDFDLRGRDVADAPVYWANLWECLGYEASPRDAPYAAQRYHPERWHPDDRQLVHDALTALLSDPTGELAVECRVLHRDGSVRWLLNRGRAVLDAGGKPVRLIGASIDITERKELERQLLRAKDAAEAASRAKDDFLANVSHEMRTPMNVILGVTELLLETELTDEQSRWLSTVKKSADNLLVTIDELLDFSKVEAGKVELDSAPFSLSAELDHTLTLHRLRAREGGLELRSRVEAGVPDALVGDARRLRQILSNLVGNAVKFTERGAVDVVVDTDRDLPSERVLLRFEVHDTGIGIPRSKQALVFQAFAQVDTSTTRRYGGTGLGLTVAARLAALMGGAVTLDSEPGRGSTFTFTAPFVEGSAPARVPEGHRVAAAQSMDERGQSLHVLVAEDDPFNAELLCQLLQRQGHTSELAKDGHDVVARVQEGGIDLVILDLRMPGLDGVTVATRIRERERASGAHLPVITLTAHTRPADRERSLAAGMDEFLTKPVRAGDLFAAIQRALTRHRTAAH